MHKLAMNWLGLCVEVWLKGRVEFNYQKTEWYRILLRLFLLHI